MPQAPISAQHHSPREATLPATRMLAVAFIISVLTLMEIRLVPRSPLQLTTIPMFLQLSNWLMVISSLDGRPIIMELDEEKLSTRFMTLLII